MPQGETGRDGCPPFAGRGLRHGASLAIGPGRVLKDGSRQKLQVKVGDVVLFTNWAGDEFKRSHGDDVLLMREEDVLAVLEK